MGAVLPGPGTPVGGSVGSLTFSRNRYGAYVRNRTKPVNPNSARQSAARTTFAAAVAIWQTLTYAQRSAWDAWAAATPWLNKAGETVNLTGQAAFIRRYCSAFTGYGGASGTQLLPPVANDVGSINVQIGTPVDGAVPCEFDFATQTLDLTSLPQGNLFVDPLTNTSSVANGRYTLQVTPPQNPTRWFPGSRWVDVVQGTKSWSYDAGPPTVIDWPGTLDSGFTYQVGHRIWLRARGIGEIGPSGTERRTTTHQIIGPIDLITPSP